MTSAVSDTVLRAATRQCEQDGAARWLGSPEPVRSIVLLGSVLDPEGAGARLQLDQENRPGSLFGYDWAERLPSRSAFVYLRPSMSADSRHVFGPKLGEPEGIYRVVSRPNGDPACQAWRAHLAVIREGQTIGGRSPSPELLNTISQGSCFAYSFVGPLNLSDYSHYGVDYLDRRAQPLGYSRRVRELRRASGDVVARAVSYQTDIVPAPPCFFNRGSFTTLGLGEI